MYVVTSAQPRDVINNLGVYVQQQGTTCGFSGSDAWVVLSPIEQSIKRKIESVGKPLRDWDISINYGIKTGYNDAFIITTERRDEILSNCKSEEERQRTNDIIRPILRGRDIKRYSYDWAGLWLIATFPSKHYDIEQYPAVKQHLLSFGKERLEQSGKEYLINGEKVKARKKTNNQWFETQDSISYSDDFLQPKIVWIELTDESKFALSTDGLIPLNTVFFMVGKHIKYLLAVINSSLIHWYFQHTLGSTSGVGTNRWLKYTVECIPVPLIQDDAEWESLVDDIQEYKRGSKDSAYLENIIDNKVFDLYGLSEDERAYLNNCPK